MITFDIPEWAKPGAKDKLPPPEALRCFGETSFEFFKFGDLDAILELKHVPATAEVATVSSVPGAIQNESESKVSDEAEETDMAEAPRSGVKKVEVVPAEET